MKKPNILFLFPDTHRGDWMPYDKVTFKQLGMDPLPLRMPNIQSLMNRGVTFTQALTPSPLCAPARACVASGLRYHKTEVKGNKDNYPLERRTFYSVLKENGYRVGGVGKFDLHKPSHWWGLEGWIDELGVLGFTDAVDNAGKMDAVNSGQIEPKDPYMKYLYEQGLAELHLKDMKNRGHRTEPTELPDEAYCDNWLSQNGVNMLREFPKDQPWFLMANFTGPHGPWDITRKMKESVDGIEFPSANQCEMDPHQLNSIRQNYAAMLENIDRNIGLLLREVAKRGELDNTIVIYSSDHGDMLGDFNKWGKSKPERGSVHIPLVISGPGIQEGIYSDALVELQDIAATVLDMAGLHMHEAEDSLTLKQVLIGNQTSHRNVVISAFESKGQGNWNVISDGTWKLIEEGNEYRLYNLKNDPWENNNVYKKNETVSSSLLQKLNITLSRS